MFLCVYVFTKYACVKPFTGQKAKTVLNGFTKIVDILNVNQINDGLIKEENLTITRWFDDNDSLMYFNHDEHKSVVTERFIRTLKSKIYIKWQLMIANVILDVWIS